MKVKKELHTLIDSESFKLLELLAANSSRKKGQVIDDMLEKFQVFGSEIRPITFSDLNLSMKRIPTGISGLDELLDGGFPVSFLISVSGEPGSGKTIFGLQFLLGSQDKGMLFTFDEDASQLRKHAFQFGCDLSKSVKSGHILIFNQKTICVQDILDRIIENKPKRVVIDSVAANCPDSDEPTAWYPLIAELKRSGATCLLITRCNENGKSNVFESRSDGAIHLEMAISKDQWERFIIIRKMRATPLERVRIPFRITDKGITPDSGK